MTADTDGPGFEEALRVLRTHWGFETFRGGQEAIVRDVLRNRDLLGVLPTGGGKSLCYQLPAVVSEGLTLVISPLVALMADQVTGLVARGIPATWLGATLSYGESERRWDDLIAGRYRLLYVAPERLSSDRFRARAGRLRIRRIAVDEAHCVSEWGHDFRPDFLQIAEARRMLGDPPMVALTATATPPVRRDVIRLLGLRDPAVHVHGFDRPALVWSVFTDGDKMGRVTDVLDAVPGGGIVYTSTRKGVEHWADRLRRHAGGVEAYHAGLPAADRWKAQEAWTAGRARVMVATSAFGMGIDRPDVRFVVHVDPPGSLEAYYQEAGRAGRDGGAAHAVLLATARDREARTERLRAEHPGPADVRKVYDVACSMAGIAVGSHPGEAWPLDDRRIAGVTGVPVTAVRRAVEHLSRQGAWAVVEPPAGEGLLRMDASPDALRSWADRSGSERLVGFVDALLRHVPADAWSTAQPFVAGSAFRDHDAEWIAAAMSLLAERGQIAWQPPGSASRFRLLHARPRSAPVDAAALRRAHRRATERFRDLMAYVDALGCRRRFLLAYFGEAAADRCGRCDACTGRHDPYVPVPSDREALHALLLEADGRGPADPAALSGVPAWRRRAMRTWLVQEGLLEPDPDDPDGWRPTAAGRDLVARRP